MRSTNYLINRNDGAGDGEMQCGGAIALYLLKKMGAMRRVEQNPVRPEPLLSLILPRLGHTMRVF